MFALNVITVGKLYPLIYSMMIIFRVGTIFVKANLKLLIKWFYAQFVLRMYIFTFSNID